LPKAKGCELCGLAAPSNESKGFYKSNRRNFGVPRFLHSMVSVSRHRNQAGSVATRGSDIMNHE
jgi:hypothetical protein